MNFNLKENKMPYIPMPKKPLFIIEKPSQYDIGIDTFQRAEANMTKEEIIASCKFNIDKYCWRKKGQDKEDFEKIINYAKFALKQFKDE